MSIKIPAAELAGALKAAASIVEARNTLPILAMVRLSADNGVLSITTSSLDVEYMQNLDATVDGSFSCCVDAGVLRDMSAKAKGIITLTLDGAVLHVKSGKSRWKLPAIPTSDFPTMPVANMCKPMPFDPEMIQKRLVWVAGKEATRTYLSGVYANEVDGTATYVATDGNAMASAATSVKWPESAPAVILATAFIKALPDEVGTLEWDEVKARFTSGNITVTGKVIDGRYPDYRRVFPQPCEPYAVDATEFVEALGRVSVASREQAQSRRVRVKRMDGALGIRIEGTSGFEGDEMVDADCTEGFEMGVNSYYLSEMLKAMDADTVSIEHGNANVPILIRPMSQPTGFSFSGVIMPMRI